MPGEANTPLPLQPSSSQLCQPGMTPDISKCPPGGGGGRGQCHCWDEKQWMKEFIHIPFLLSTSKQQQPYTGSNIVKIPQGKGEILL